MQAARVLLDQLLASDALRALVEFAPQLTQRAIEMSPDIVPYANQMVSLGRTAAVSDLLLSSGTCCAAD